MGYSPLDDGLPFSTVNLFGGPLVLAVWALILADKDRDGITKLNPDAIYRQWLESREPRSLDAVMEAWEYLASPDPKSKSQEEGGRRIVPTGDGRWKVVNSEKYRERYTLERRRKQLVDAQRRHRDKVKAAAGSDGAADAQVALEARVHPEPSGDAGSVRAAVAVPPSAAPSVPVPAIAEGAMPRFDWRALPPRVRVVNGLTGEEQPFDGGGIFETLEARKEAEIEAMRIARLIADRDGTEPLEELSLASQWRDSSKLRVETMTHERLWHTLKRLRTKWEQREPKGLSLEDQARARLLGKAQA